MAGCGISGVEPWGSAAGELISRASIDYSGNALCYGIN